VLGNLKLENVFVVKKTSNDGQAQMRVEYFSPIFYDLRCPTLKTRNRVTKISLASKRWIDRNGTAASTPRAFSRGKYS
jgi:hypothetical protein